MHARLKKSNDSELLTRLRIFVFLRRENSGKFWSWSISETRFSYTRSLCIRTKSSKKVASRSSTLNNDEFSFCRMAKELSLDWFHGALLAPGRSYLVSTPTLQITSLGLKASWTDFIILYYIHKNYLLILIKAQIIQLFSPQRLLRIWVLYPLVGWLPKTFRCLVKCPYWRNKPNWH